MTNVDVLRRALDRKLRRESRHLVDELHRLRRKYPINSPEWDNYIAPQIAQMLQRWGQIKKELEQCTGVKVPARTIEDILEENKRKQSGAIKIENSDNHSHRHRFTKFPDFSTGQIKTRCVKCYKEIDDRNYK